MKPSQNSWQTLRTHVQCDAICLQIRKNYEAQPDLFPLVDLPDPGTGSDYGTGNSSHVGNHPVVIIRSSGTADFVLVQTSVTVLSLFNMSSQNVKEAYAHITPPTILLSVGRERPSPLLENRGCLRRRHHVRSQLQTHIACQHTTARLRSPSGKVMECIQVSRGWALTHRHGACSGTWRAKPRPTRAGATGCSPGQRRPDAWMTGAWEFREEDGGP